MKNVIIWNAEKINSLTGVNVSSYEDLVKLEDETGYSYSSTVVCADHNELITAVYNETDIDLCCAIIPNEDALTHDVVLSSNDMMLSTLRGFLEAMLFTNEEFDGYGIIDISIDDISDIYSNYIEVFINMVDASSTLMEEAENHGFVQLGRDMYFDLDGHGVGLWEQKETAMLDKLWTAMRDSKVVTPFESFIEGDVIRVSLP